MAATEERASARQEPVDLAHVGPGTLAGRYLRTFWQPVYLATELPAGKAFPLKILNEDFTIYRGESGTPHVLAFRCAHRQNQLSIGWVEGDRIRCFYHGWMYDGMGQCVQQPAEFTPFCDRIKIPGCPTEEYLGMIWAYFGEGEPPPLPHYPDLDRDGVKNLTTYVRDSNYFQSLENTPDHVHIFFVHYARAGTGRADSPVALHDLDAYTAWRRKGGEEGFEDFLPHITAEETEWGMAIKNSYDFGEYQNGIAMPNIARRGSAWAWRVPVDDESYKSFNLTQDISRLLGKPAQPEGAAEGGQRTRAPKWTGDPRPANDIIEAIKRGENHIDEYFKHPESGSIQDGIAQTGQGRITDRSKEHLGASDLGIIELRRIWSRELRKLAAGEPLKQWVIPPSMAGHEGMKREG